MRKTYSELILLPTFKERFEYLQTQQFVGDITFGGSRWLNQQLYTSKEWINFRREIILRDNCCDLALEGFEICGKVIIHHLNTITKEQILERDYDIFNPNNVVCVSFDTHNAIHYGNECPNYKPVIRTKNDTCPWK